jgi:hypothetical protein
MKKAANMKKAERGSKVGRGGDSPSWLIDARINELSDWRSEFGVLHELGSVGYN